MRKNENSKRKFEDINSDANESNLAERSRTSSMNNSEYADDIYEVEEIVSKKTCRGKYLYQVKWVGYPSDQNTWEPIENLKNVQYLIEDFENLNESLKRRKKTQKQPESKEEVIEKVIEKYGEYGLKDLIKNKNVSPGKNKSGDITRSTDENEEKSLNKSLNNFCANEALRIEPKFKEFNKNQHMGDISIDKPLQIKWIKSLNNQFTFFVKWEKRENGFEPFDSWVEHEPLKKLFPFMLIDFYESKLKVKICQIDSENKEKEN